jgi:hypothetical protein
MKQLLLISLLLFSCRENTKKEIVYINQSNDSLIEANIYLENELNRCYDENQLLGSILAEYEMEK